MIDWISKKHREKKRRETHECQLKKSLAEKISQYEQSRSISNDNSPEDEFTEVFIDGKNLRVAKEQITIKGDWAELFMCARSSWRAMVRKESPQTIPLDISSRSERVSASPERWRPRGRIPPMRAKFLVIAEWLVSKARAIALSDSPCCQRSHISDFSVAVYHLRFLRDISNTSSFHLKIKCCVDQLNLPPETDTAERLFREHGRILLTSVSYLPYPGLTSILIGYFIIRCRTI